MPFVLLFCGIEGLAQFFFVRNSFFGISDLTIPAFPWIREVMWGAFVATQGVQIYLYIYVAGLCYLFSKSCY